MVLDQLWHLVRSSAAVDSGVDAGARHRLQPSTAAPFTFRSRRLQLHSQISHACHYGNRPCTDLVVAKARKELGFSWQFEQSRRVVPPPRFGGSGGYHVWYREIQLEKFHVGEAIEVSLSSIYRWDVHPSHSVRLAMGRGRWFLGSIFSTSSHILPHGQMRPLMRWLILFTTRGGIFTPAMQYLIAFKILMSRGKISPPKDTRHRGRTLSFVSGDFGIVFLLLVY